MKLPPYATDMGYDQCEKNARGILGHKERVNVQKHILVNY